MVTGDLEKQTLIQPTLEIQYSPILMEARKQIQRKEDIQNDTPSYISGVH